MIWVYGQNMVREALKNATGELLPEIDELFEGVYEKMPNSLGGPSRPK